MNRRQRRGVVMLVLTAIGAIVVFFSVLTYVGDVNAQVGNKVDVLELTKNVDAYKPIDSSAYQVVQVPEKWTTNTTLRSASDLTGLVAASALPKGAILQKGMVVPPPEVQPGYREIAIIVDAETGVAGKIKPGDHVDIIATVAKDDSGPARAEIWVSNALVLEVGTVTQSGGSDNAGNFQSTSGVPVTFALTSQDALRLAYVESFSVKLRLALRGAGDDTQVPPDRQVYEGS